jgi:hypothetical protein
MKNVVHESVDGLSLTLIQAPDNAISSVHLLSLIKVFDVVFANTWNLLYSILIANKRDA